MNTPICDFVRRYIEGNPVRMHMPGHKGAGPLGIEKTDITEIDGAGSLYTPGGIIAQSEAIASRLFGARTYYSAEGSSLAIRAMLLLAIQATGEKPTILAGRNAHRALVSAAALLDLDVRWLWPGNGASCHRCDVGPDEVEAALGRMAGRPCAVYLTSPDYLGHLLDIAAIARVCRRHGALLLVDNAHGAYLKWLSPSRHPMDLGADLCCDSAHKTLPALTGAAWLHVRANLGPDDQTVKEALALFGSSSPSWLILQSLDACNPYLEALSGKLADFLPKLDVLKAALAAHGYTLVGNEPMKLTLAPRSFGYRGDELAERLWARGIGCELHDPDFLVLMPTPMNSDGDLEAVEAALLALPRRAPLAEYALPLHVPRRALSIREATLAPRETLPAEQCLGRILASPAVSCPPCVPIAVCGERVDGEVLARLGHYGIGTCEVVR